MGEMVLSEIPCGHLRKRLADEGSEYVAAFETPDGLRILKSIDFTPHGRLLHVSMSRADRYPSWEEIKAVKEHFFGDNYDAVMVFPRSSLWVNVHPNTFHLWQLPKIPGDTGRWELM